MLSVYLTVRRFEGFAKESGFKEDFRQLINIGNELLENAYRRRSSTSFTLCNPSQVVLIDDREIKNLANSRSQHVETICSTEVSHHDAFVNANSTSYEAHGYELPSMRMTLRPSMEASCC